MMALIQLKDCSTIAPVFSPRIAATVGVRNAAPTARTPPTPTSTDSHKNFRSGILSFSCTRWFTTNTIPSTRISSQWL